MEYVMLNVRGAFMDAVYEPKPFKAGDEPRVGMNAIIDMSTEAGKKVFAEVQALILKVAKDKWGDEHMSVLKTLKAKGDLCLHSGEEKEKYDGFKGNFFVSASNTISPLIVDMAGKPIPKATGKVYAGAYYNVKVDIWAQQNSYGKRVNAKLLVIQKVSDAAAFGGNAPPTLDGMPMMEVGSGPSDASSDESSDAGDLFAN